MSPPTVGVPNAEYDDAVLERVGRAIAASMWGEAQAATFFKIKTRNCHYGMALNAARDALRAYHRMRSDNGDAQ